MSSIHHSSQVNICANSKQAIQISSPLPPLLPPRDADQSQRGSAFPENGDKSDPTSDLAKTVAVGTGAGLAATGATAAGMQ